MEMWVKELWKVCVMAFLDHDVNGTWGIQGNRIIGNLCNKVIVKHFEMLNVSQLFF